MYYAPSPLNFNSMKFLMTRAPDDATMGAYVSELKKHDVTVLVRACEPSYNEKMIREAGIEVVDLSFSDGKAPPKKVIKKWLKLVEMHFKLEDSQSKALEDTTSGPAFEETEVTKLRPLTKSRIGVHCVAGLGRSPLLVVCALIQLGGCTPMEAIKLVRESRPKTLN